MCFLITPAISGFHLGALEVTAAEQEEQLMGPAPFPTFPKAALLSSIDIIGFHIRFHLTKNSDASF